MKKPKAVMNQSEFPGIPLDQKQSTKLPGNGQPEILKSQIQPNPKPPKRTSRHKVKMNPSKFNMNQPMPTLNK